jgi:hypothetical protein
MDGQINWEILDHAFEALNWFSSYLGKDYIEECITLQKLDSITAKLLWKKLYTWLYWWGHGEFGEQVKISVSIKNIIQYWHDWELIKNLNHASRIWDKLSKKALLEWKLWKRISKDMNFSPFQFDNVDFELHVMANIIRAWWNIDILEESIEKTPDFRLRFDSKGEWIYSEITRRWTWTWDYAKWRADKMVNIIKDNIIWKEATLAIKRVISDEEFERLLKWLRLNPCDMSEFEDFALFYTSNHWVDKMSLSFEYINAPFFCTWWGWFENDNFIHIHAPYQDGIISKITDGNRWQLISSKKNILFIDSSHTTYLESREIIDTELQKEENSHISVIILVRIGGNIKSEVLIIKNPKAINPISDADLEKISSEYNLL